MKFKALKYGEFLMGHITAYKEKRPLFVNFIECIEKEIQEWRVEFKPNSGLKPGMVLTVDNIIFCEIIINSSAISRVRLLNPKIDIFSIWQEINHTANDSESLL